jgi:lysophospholipid acyltransferase (LPLAT)-like uncharacterized protein
VSATTSQISDDTARQPAFSLGQRLALGLISWAGCLAIRLLGPTLRVAISFEEGAPDNLETPPIIAPFWHRSVFAAAYVFRNLQVRVMTSRSFDGEYIARIIRKLGFKAVRGSSSRGAVGALLAVRREIEHGFSVAFTIDGPRGPQYVAKPGPVLLAKLTGIPIVPFYIALDNPWVLSTWDRLMIPKPFSRALIRVARNIKVPADTNEDQMPHFCQEMQDALDRIREFAEANVHNNDFPEYKRKIFLKNS